MNFLKSFSNKEEKLLKVCIIIIKLFIFVPMMQHQQPPMMQQQQPPMMQQQPPMMQQQQPSMMQQQQPRMMQQKQPPMMQQQQLKINVLVSMVSQIVILNLKMLLYIEIQIIPLITRFLILGHALRLIQQIKSLRQIIWLTESIFSSINKETYKKKYILL